MRLTQVNLYSLYHAGKHTHGKRDDSIRAAKSLQHPAAQPFEGFTDGAINVRAHKLSSPRQPEIHVVDSVLSLEGCRGVERGFRVHAKHV